MKAYKCRKILLKIINFLTKFGLLLREKPKLTERQIKLISIIRKVINDPKSELTVDPLLSNCYVEYNGNFFILSANSIEIYGSSDSYTDIPLIIGERLVQQFYRSVSQRRINKEEKYKKITIKKLEKIQADIS